MVRFVAAVCGGLLLSTHAAGQYTFRKVADTAAGSGYYSLSFANAAINAGGAVAFYAQLSANSDDLAIVRVSASGTTQVIASATSGPFAGHQFYPNSTYGTPLPLAASLSMNASGEVAFSTATEPNTGRFGVYKSDGTTVTTISAPISQANPNAVGSRPSLPIRVNDAGAVMFTASDNIQPTAHDQVYTGSGAGLTRVSIQPNGVQSAGWAQNNAGTVVYRTYNQSTGEYTAVRATAAGVASTVFNSSIAASTGIDGNTDGTQLDAAGRVYFTGSDASGGGIFRWDNGTLTKILSGTVSQNISVNGSGQVLTGMPEGNSSSPGYALFLGENSSFKRMIGFNDELDGSTIIGIYSDFVYGQTSLNDDGQIVFRARLADGRTGLFVATPVPEPACLLALAAVAVAGVRLRGCRS